MIKYLPKRILLIKKLISFLSKFKNFNNLWKTQINQTKNYRITLNIYYKNQKIVNSLLNNIDKIKTNKQKSLKNKMKNYKMKFNI